MIRLVRLLVLLLILVLSVSAGCVAKDDPEERNAALTAFVDSLGLQPLPGDGAVKRGREEIKSGDPYFIATGVLEGSRESGVQRVESALEEQGFEVFDSGAVPYSFGWCVRGQSGAMVAASWIGWSEQSGYNPYPQLPGRVYVQTLIGRKGEAHGWNDPDRPRCGTG
jgi:hypothetical protein